MPAEKSFSRGGYARRGGGGRGRGAWRGGSKNKQYPGRPQNEDGSNNGGNHWERPRTSTPLNRGDSQGQDMGMMQRADAVGEMGPPPPPPTQQRRRVRMVENCPWADWDTYLPQEDYHEGHEFNTWIHAFHRYLLSTLQWQSKKMQTEIERRGLLVVNFKAFVQECPIDNLDLLVIERPSTVIGCLALAALQTYYGAEAVKETQQKRLVVRFARFDRMTHGKDLKANLIGKLVCVRGTVVRTSGVKPLATKMSFTCNTCQGVQTLDFPEARYIQPSSCPQVGCKSRQFTPQRGVGYETETVDWQTVRLQEKLPDDRNDSGRVPRTIECEVTKDLVDRVIPGDVVEMTGIVKVAQSEKGYSRVKTGNTMYLIYLDVNYITKATMTKEEDELDDEEEDSKESSKDSIQITTKDLYAIEEVHMEPQLFKLIVNSFSPAIFGHEMVKAGILFALFGGRRRNKTVVDRTAIRSDPHVLVVGDPGLGKSQMLSAAVKAAPRGVYVCGSSGISTSGLTVTLVRGSGSDFALEAGALVLGDQGCCCIDEFDKMTTDHNALLEAMEQQTISIAKAGIICTLPARTSVIAAANPVGGHYNMSKTVAENLKMNSALLSRFDLIFILMDKPDGEMDQYLSKHVMALHSGNVANGPAFRSGSSQESDFGRSSSQNDQSQPSQRGGSGSRSGGIGVKPEMDRPLSERLRMTSDDNMQLIPLPLLRKYIAYARKYVHPRLSSEAATILQEFYLMMRAKHRSPDGTPVTTRQLESMIRMAEAKARMECREVVTRRDAMDVIEVMTFSLQDIFGTTGVHGSTGPAQGGSGRGKSGSIKRYVAELQRIAFAASNNIFSSDHLYRVFQEMQLAQHGVTGGFQDFIDTLNHQSFLLKKGPRTYQLATMM